MLFQALIPSHVGSLLADPEDEQDSTSPSLISIRAVAAYEPFIENARSLVTTEMENMVLRGLTTLVRFISLISFD